MKQVIILFAVLITGVVSYPGGAPPEVCESMKPGHGDEPQTDPCPYMLEVYAKPEGDEVMVTVSAAPNDFFMGMLLQARNSDGKPVGTFKTIDDQVQVVTCPDGENNAVTHNLASNITWVAVKWMPENEDPVDFTLTVLRTEHVYWLGEKVAYGTATGIQASALALSVLLVLQKFFS